MSSATWAQQSTHPFKPSPNASLLSHFKCAVLNLTFSTDFLSDNPRSHAFGYFEHMERESNEHIYFDTEETVPQWVIDRLSGARYLHVEIDSSQTANGRLVGRRVSPAGKSIFQIQVRASIRNEKSEVGIDTSEGPVYWTLVVQFDLEHNSSVCGMIGNWTWVIRLLRDAVAGGFREDGGPAGGKRRATPHVSIAVRCASRGPN